MSESDDKPVSPVDAYAVLARAFDTIIVHRKHASGDELAKLAVESLAAHGLTVYQAEGPKVRQATAIDEARKLLRQSKTDFARTGAQAACASALQGILVVMTEQLESQWDTPCDCFAGLPQLTELDTKRDLDFRIETANDPAATQAQWDSTKDECI